MTKVKLNSCDDCSGLCCITPPALVSEDEIKIALLNGARVISTIEPNTDLYRVAISKSGYKVCPFLKNGKCSIYITRFKSCRTFSCSMLNNSGASLQDIASGNIGTVEDSIRNIFFDIEIIENYKIPILSNYDYMEETVVADKEMLISMILQISNFKEAKG